MIVWGERLSHGARGRQAVAALLALARKLNLPGTEGAGLIEIPTGTNGRGLREVGCLPNLGPGLADAPSDITEAVVARYYGGRVETNAFAVADAAIAGRHGEALIALRHALDSGADPVPMVAAFAMKVRTMGSGSAADARRCSRTRA